MPGIFTLSQLDFFDVSCKWIYSPHISKPKIFFVKKYKNCISDSMLIYYGSNLPVEILFSHIFSKIYKFCRSSTANCVSNGNTFFWKASILPFIFLSCPSKDIFNREITSA